ncbi:MAG: di-trans,poly-cis-decaprenylcistransferase [Desulfovibrionaceae bacterium]|nr:di-trans,poly-cis-decaprenylcistransferase [Desulfovibrionaceae bacterium]
MTDSTLPRHIAVIMDGNGRWAQQRGLARSEGHRAGAGAVCALVRECRALGIPFVTLYAFSRENWQRPQTEVSFLFELFTRFVREELPGLLEQDIRLSMIGERTDLPFAARRAMDYAIQRTAACRGMVLTLALSYSGREEIVRAARALAATGLPPGEWTEESFRRGLYDPDLPDPDLLIRTSGELRISNFLLFQSAYTELYFSPGLWPDFDAAALREALQSYAERRRRFGRVEDDRDRHGEGDAGGSGQ